MKFLEKFVQMPYLLRYCKRAQREGVMTEKSRENVEASVIVAFIIFFGALDTNMKVNPKTRGGYSLYRSDGYVRTI